MAFQSVPDCAQATIVGVVNGVIVNTTLTFAKSGGSYDQTDIDDLATAVDDWFSTEILPSLSSDALYSSTEVRGLESIIDLLGIESAGGGAGGGSGTALPALTAACVSFRTGFTGRSARGRNYVWGLTTDSLGSNENTIASGTQSFLIAAYDALPGYLVGTPWAHVVVSRYTNNVKRTTGVYLPITDYILTDNLWDTQRRRK